LCDLDVTSNAAVALTGPFAAEQKELLERVSSDEKGALIV
jgi:hypothetical protein